MGRPSIPPSQLAKVLLLQHRTGASDEQAMEAVCWDLRWKIALGLPVDHEGWHPTSLTRFRARLLLHNKERLALENTLGDLREANRYVYAAGDPANVTDPLGTSILNEAVKWGSTIVKGARAGFSVATGVTVCFTANELEDIRNNTNRYGYYRDPSKPSPTLRQTIGNVEA